MTSLYSNDRPSQRRQGGFIRWATPSPRHSQGPMPDPGFVVDRRQLYKYLDSLEGLSGE
ncbi:hypothetical protein IQ254_05975 [Nodosilinea sp. LEGE 07088]|uniref:hypothetical protein n=1 Tax=Nodosilinea sp. LEGE 07088 TaxID=2777968 RepID=UPI001881DEA7|nr:hypothetical protein [Nodosilinea sp. LEGE 07088]MBE9136754.1 hypothetical protein [Nodosilinea sp. LEGE 07088]